MRIANVADTIVVQIGLVGITREWAVVGRVRYAIIIIVSVAGVANAVMIRIELIRICG